MRSEATFGRLTLSPPLQAAVLLAVLLTHLAFMASPLHARMMADESHGIDTSLMRPGQDVLTFEQSPERDEHVGHCVIEWLKLDQQLTPVMLVAGVDAAFLVPGFSVPGSRPAARALGPPTAGDRQALLQVFRE
jgi:hypothetical protein